MGCVVVGTLNLEENWNKLNLFQTNNKIRVKDRKKKEWIQVIYEHRMWLYILSLRQADWREPQSYSLLNVFFTAMWSKAGNIFRCIIGLNKWINWLFVSQNSEEEGTQNYGMGNAKNPVMMDWNCIRANSWFLKSNITCKCAHGKCYVHMHTCM